MFTLSHVVEQAPGCLCGRVGLLGERAKDAEVNRPFEASKRDRCAEEASRW